MAGFGDGECFLGITVSATLLVLWAVAGFSFNCTHIEVPLVPALTFKMLDQIYVLVVFLLNVC